MTIVTVDHLRECGYCANGTRDFFERHGLDFKDFVKNGIDAQKLLDTQDILAIKLVEVANGWKA